MKKNRFVTWAVNEKEEKVLLTLELNIDTSKVECNTFSTKDLNTTITEELFTKWITEEYEVTIPFETSIKNFTDESIVPDNIKIEGKTGAIRQLQNEWSYLILSSKLFSQFSIELEEIKKKAFASKEFSAEIFEETKKFWEKVLDYKREKEISQEKLNQIKEEINSVFDHLKNLKETMFKQKDEIAQKVSSEINEKLNLIKANIELEGVIFKSVMEELKEIHQKLKEIDLKRDAKNNLYDEIQKTFEIVKQKRDIVLGGGLKDRITNLSQIAEKINNSIMMDKKDLEFNKKKVLMSDTKLEQQLREAKIKVIEDRIVSKEMKYNDIIQSINKLNSKTEKKSTAKETSEQEVEVKVIVKDKKIDEVNKPLDSNKKDSTLNETKINDIVSKDFTEEVTKEEIKIEIKEERHDGQNSNEDSPKENKVD